MIKKILVAVIVGLVILIVWGSTLPDIPDEPVGELTVGDVEDMLPWGEGHAKVFVDGGTVYITRPGDDEWTLDLYEAQIDTIEIFKSLFEDDRVETVSVTSRSLFVDKYGNENEADGAIYTMTRETANRVNWDRDAYMWSDNLNSIADGYWIHPSVY